MEARTSVNLLDLLTPSEIGAFVSGDLIGKIDRENEEEKVVDTMRKLGSYEIVICKYYDFFRFGHFDLAIYYNFTDVAKFVDSCCTVDNKLLLLSEDDYHNTRNLITAELVTMDNLSAIVMRMVSKNIKKENIGRKRYYSGSIDDKLLDCYSISKQ